MAWRVAGQPFSTQVNGNQTVIGNSTVTGILTAQHAQVVNNSTDASNPELDLVARNADWFFGIDTANVPPGRDLVLAGQRGTWSFEDAVTNGTTTLTSAAQGGFTAACVGAAISGTNIPAGTTISAVASATSLTMSNAATGSGTNRATITRPISAVDYLYLKHRGGLAPTFGVGVTPPDGSASLQVIGSGTAEPAMGTARFIVNVGQTGKALAANDTGQDRWWVASDFYMSGNHAATGGAIAIQGDATNGRPLVLSDNAKANFYGFQFSGSSVVFRQITGGVDIVGWESAGGFRHLSTLLGFYGATAVTKPTVTGSKGANAALTSLMAALSSLGLVTDSTT